MKKLVVLFAVAALAGCVFQPVQDSAPVATADAMMYNSALVNLIYQDRKVPTLENFAQEREPVKWM